MTAPLVPPNVLLRDFAYMPLDVLRLRDSELVSHATGEGFRCAVLLWCVSWHQSPAGSLPNDDKALANFVGYGRSPKEWKRHRDDALRGWVLCSDGRLYHPVVAEKANEAWTERLRARWRSECGRIKKAAQRAQQQANYPTFEQWREHFESTGQEQWRPGIVPIAVPGDMQGSPREVTRDEGTKGSEAKRSQGKPSEAEEQKLPPTDGLQQAESHLSARVESPPGAMTEAGRACRLMREAGCFSTNPSHVDLLAALDEGVTPEALADTVREGLTKSPPIAKPFAWAITTARGRNAAGASLTNGVPRGTDQPRESLVDRNARRAREIFERTGTG